MTGDRCWVNRPIVVPASFEHIPESAHRHDSDLSAGIQIGRDDLSRSVEPTGMNLFGSPYAVRAPTVLGRAL